MIRRIAALSLAAGLLPGAALVDLGTAPSASAAASPSPSSASDGRPHNARLTIPHLGIRRLKVVAYTGKTDDGPGTKIQNRGIAASPNGPQGGVGPGGIGNYQVTGHRVSHGGVFRRVPSLHKGSRVFVDMGGWRYIYKIVKTRWVSFRSPASLRAQRAAVPGKPGATPTQAYITISTCATPEDHARGNYWTDRYGNPEHRIDKIGVLVRRVHVPRRYRHHS
ncbi:sortase domain-bontaining protein [Nocardioides sp. Kera G14]|uniref:sortase domain-containing protein n=1 Tax=Nocardioides sp. Kera G14 TaxID=2884264 RepID=UPI001D12C7B3|nr:sortase [Nocardioides sp. Kera G14]UDY25236.1 sortase [Nocardioides sp. Kera G14]